MTEPMTPSELTATARAMIPILDAMGLEVLGGLMAGFMDVPGGLPLVKRLEIDFTRPAMTAVTARTTLSEAEFDRVQAEAVATGKSNYELVAEVTDEAGTVVARTRGFYQMRVMG